MGVKNTTTPSERRETRNRKRLSEKQQRERRLTTYHSAPHGEREHARRQKAQTDRPPQTHPKALNTYTRTEKGKKRKEKGPPRPQRHVDTHATCDRRQHNNTKGRRTHTDTCK